MTAEVSQHVEDAIHCLERAARFTRYADENQLALVSLQAVKELLPKAATVEDWARVLDLLGTAAKAVEEALTPGHP